jgi:hypothetical protein
MTALRAIRETIARVVPSWQIEAGFGSDINDFLASNRVGKRAAFISVEGDTPYGGAEDGRASCFVSTFMVYLRSRSEQAAEADEVYAQYKAIRAALNGCRYENDSGGRSTITITGGTPSVDGGYTMAQLTLQTVEPA